MKLAFFGTPALTLPVLNALKEANMEPSLVIASPDKPIGRKQIITSPPSIRWATEQNIATWQPESINELRTEDTPLTNFSWDIFVVFAYGIIIPKKIINLPKYKTLNVHPSLLPKLRGPSPVRTAILHDINPTGVTIMLLDEHMDHGPILSQAEHKTPTKSWPPTADKLEQDLVNIGAELLVQTINSWTQDGITPKNQEHEKATFSRKIRKHDAEISLDPFELPKDKIAYEALRKIKAYSTWPESFFIYKNKKVKIKNAYITQKNELIIERVLPEGKNEMDFSVYLQSISN